MTYPIQPGPSFPACKTGEGPKPKLFGLRRRPELTFPGRPCLAMLFNIATPAAATWTLTREPSNLWISYEESQLNINWKHTTYLAQAQLLCHPKNWLCRSERKPALDTSSHFTAGPHGDNVDSPPKYQIQNYTVTLNTIPHASDNTRCFLNISLRHFISNTNKPKLHESCSTKSKPYSML